MLFTEISYQETYMKKFLLIAILSSIFTCSIFAEQLNLAPEKDESKWTDLNYVNVPILKVLDSKEGYVVIYQKKNAGTASVVIPKSWATPTKDSPRKLKLRKIKNPNESFMTIVKKGSEFHRVILTMPLEKNNSLWGVVDYSLKVEGTDKDTLEELDL